MKSLKKLLVLGAVAGAVAVVVRRRQQKSAADAALWSDATDTVR